MNQAPCLTHHLAGQEPRSAQSQHKDRLVGAAQPLRIFGIALDTDHEILVIAKKENIRRHAAQAGQVYKPEVQPQRRRSNHQKVEDRQRTPGRARHDEQRGDHDDVPGDGHVLECGRNIAPRQTDMQCQHGHGPGQGEGRDSYVKTAVHRRVIPQQVDLDQVVAVKGYNARQADEVDAHLAGPGFDPPRVLPKVIACHDSPGSSARSAACLRDKGAEDDQ